MVRKKRAAVVHLDEVMSTTGMFNKLRYQLTRDNGSKCNSMVVMDERHFEPVAAMMKQVEVFLDTEEQVSDPEFKKLKVAEQKDITERWSLTLRSMQDTMRWLRETIR